MAFRTVYGTILHPTSGKPWRNARVGFTLTPGTYVDDEDASQFPSTQVVARADADGYFEVSLFVNEGGVIASEFAVDDPSTEDAYYITVPAGSGSLSLSDARTLYAGPSDPNYESLSTYVDDAVEEAIGTQIEDGLEEAEAAMAARLGPIYVEDRPFPSAKILRFKADRAFTLPANLTGSRFDAETAATGSTVFSVRKAGSQVFTVTWSASGTTGAGSGSATSWAAGDLFELVAPATVDATLANISFLFAGTP